MPVALAGCDADLIQRDADLFLELDLALVLARLFSDEQLTCRRLTSMGDTCADTGVRRRTDTCERCAFSTAYTGVANMWTYVLAGQGL